MKMFGRLFPPLRCSTILQLHPSRRLSNLFIATMKMKKTKNKTFNRGRFRGHERPVEVGDPQSIFASKKKRFWTRFSARAFTTVAFDPGAPTPQVKMCILSYFRVIFFQSNFLINELFTTRKVWTNRDIFAAFTNFQRANRRRSFT